MRGLIAEIFCWGVRLGGDRGLVARERHGQVDGEPQDHVAVGVEALDQRAHPCQSAGAVGWVALVAVGDRAGVAGPPRSTRRRRTPHLTRRHYLPHLCPQKHDRNRSNNSARGRTARRTATLEAAADIDL